MHESCILCCCLEGWNEGIYSFGLKYVSRQIWKIAHSVGGRSKMEWSRSIIEEPIIILASSPDGWLKRKRKWGFCTERVGPPKSDAKLITEGVRETDHPRKRGERGLKENISSSLPLSPPPHYFSVHVFFFCFLHLGLLCSVRNSSVTNKRHKLWIKHLFVLLCLLAVCDRWTSLF